MSLSSESVVVKYVPATKETTGVKTPYDLEKVVGEKNIGPRGMYRKTIGGGRYKDELDVFLTVADIAENDRWGFVNRKTGEHQSVQGSDRIMRMISESRAKNQSLQLLGCPIGPESMESLVKFADDLRKHDSSLLYEPPDYFLRIKHLD